MTLLDDIMEMQGKEQAQPVAQSSWIKDLIDTRYSPQEEREIRKPIGFSFNREPFDPSSYYNQLNTQKNINVAGTNVVKQLMANKAEKEAKAAFEQNQRDMESRLSGVNANFTYDGPTGGSHNYKLKGVTSTTSKAANYWGGKYGIKDVGGYREHGSVPGSDHPKGKALDFMTYKDKKKGTALANDIVKNYKAWQVKYVIWNKHIWSPGRGWRKYSGPSPHTDHVHVSFLK